MDERRLKTFLTAAQVGSFSRAAEVLFVTQSTVTTRIRELERELDCRLFAREGRGVSLTAEGRALVRYAQRCLQSFTDARAALTAAAVRAHLRLMACHVPATYDLPHILGEHAQTSGSLDIHLQVGSSKRVFREMLQGEVDVGLVHVSFRHPDVDTEIVATRPLALVASPTASVPNRNDPAATQVFFFQEELEDALLARTICHHLGWSAENSNGISDMLALKELLSHGLGVGILPREAVAAELAAGQLVTLHEEPLAALPQQITCLLVRRQARADHRGSQLQAFLQQLYQYYAGFPTGQTTHAGDQPRP